MTTFTALLVGAGGMGQTWARNLDSHPDVRIGGWVDLRPGAAAAAAAELGLPALHADTDLQAAIGAVRPDFVVDVTIPEAHHDVTLAALAAGLPVLGEKPMAASMAQARAMVAASEQAGKLYMVSQSRRYNGQLQAFRRLIAEQVGALGMLNADFYIGAHFGGFRDAMPSPLVLDMAIHTFERRALPVRRRPGCGVLRGIQPVVELVQRRRMRHGNLRDERRATLHLPWQLVRRRPRDILGSRVARGWPERHGNLGWHRRTSGRDRDPARRIHRPGRAAHSDGRRRAWRHRRLAARFPPCACDRGNTNGRMPRQHQIAGNGLRRNRICPHRRARGNT